MSTSYSLRRLGEGDLDPMRSLNVLFGDVFEDKESYHDDPPSDDYLTRYLSDDRNIVIVAVDGREVVGGLVAYLLRKFERERSEVYLYDLAVAKNLQRQGIGKALVEKLRDTARHLGAYVVFVQADDGDDAVYFYRSLRPVEDLQTRSFDFDV